MRRIYPDYAYGSGPRQGCWWDETVEAPDWPVQQGNLKVDVAVVGGGFTGMSAALYLAQAGASVAVLEAETPGWGASGRNGGFCCLGGSKLASSTMRRRYGDAATQAYEQAEIDAVALVADLLTKNRIDADTHSNGETVLAHSPRAMAHLRRNADEFGVLHEPDDLPKLGFGGTFFGGYSFPVGFGLNPRKYLFGVAAAAIDAGAKVFQKSAALTIGRKGARHEVTTPAGHVVADQVLICTNGYSSEDMPPWLAGRYMPAQSTVMVTRPLTEGELTAQGWTSDQMAYDSRHLLHYFRLMPDRRFLFGMRGGLFSSPGAEAAIRRKVRKDFAHMFPAWAGVDVTNMWSGLVCLSRNLVPFAGAVPGQPGIYAGLAYHGNGVAMGTYCGRALAHLVLGQDANLPVPLTRQPSRIPFGRARRILMPPAYALMALADL